MTLENGRHIEELWDNYTEGVGIKSKKKKILIDELDELREHSDLVSFNIDKVFRHAKDRSRKDLNKAKFTVRKKLHHSYKFKNQDLTKW